MAKETYLGANVEVTTDSFAGWIAKTNQVRDDMGRIVVTVTTVANAEPNTVNAGLTTGNAAIAGVLTVNTMAVSADLRGGNVLSSDTLTVVSNVHFTESANVWIASNTVNFDVNASNTNITSNTIITNTLTYLLSTNTTIGDAATDVLNVNAVSDFNANVNVDGILTQTANAIFSGDLVNITSTNTTIGDAGTDALNVNAVSDFNANVNIDGITTHTANVSITDSDYLLIGTDDDLQLYHDGSDSYIDEVGTGSLYIRATNLNVQSADGTDTYITAVANGAVGIRYDNVEKLSTTADGADVLGEVALKTAGTNQIVGESTTTSYQQLDFKLRTSASNERTPLILTTSNTLIAGANSAYDLGSTVTNWRHVYAKDTTTANSAIVQNVLTVNSQANTASMMVRDLTATRITYAGTSGELVDSANLVFTGTALNVIGTANVTSSANVGGTFGVTGATALANTLNITGAVTASNTLAVTGDVTLSANLNMSDNDVIRIGTSQDLLLYHDGLHSYIDDNGTGDLYIRSNNGAGVFIQGSGETLASFADDGAVTLYWDNAAKLATKSDGVLITGELESTTLDVNGAADISGATTLGSTLGVTGDVTLSANLNLSDSDYIRLGASQDLLVYHNGVHSYIDEQGTGNLYIRSTGGNIVLQANTNENAIVAAQNGAVTLYYDNASKLATKTDGVIVTGELVADTFSVSGVEAGTDGSLTVANTLTVQGNLVVSGDAELTVNNSIVEFMSVQQVFTLGTAGGSYGDATVTGDIIPTADSTYDLGSNLVRYANVYGDLFTGSGAGLTNLNATNISSGTISDARLPATITSDITGNAATATSAVDATNADNIQVDADNTTNAAHYVMFTGGATGNQRLNSDTGITYNPSTNTLTTGTFDGAVAWANITSKPDPVVTVTLTGDVTGTGSATLTDLANGTISFATTYNNDVVLGTDTSGNYAASVAAGSGINVSGVAGEGTTFTVSHSDTSSVANVAIDNSNGTVLQDVTLTFDTYGHVTGATVQSINLDGRYYTETEADSRFVNVTGDTMSGALDMGNQQITNIEDIFINDRIGHNGDADTYLQFNADDQFRIVTGGGQRLLISNTTTTIANDLTVSGTATVSTNLIVSGNLTVSGTVTTVNTETVNIADNIVVLNSNYTGSTPSENGGIEIERGTLSNKSLVWDETADKWTVGSETFVAGTFEGALTGNVTGNASTASTLQTARTISLAGDVTGSASFNGGSNISITATVGNDSHTHDGRYYTEAESDARFLGITANAVSASKWQTARTLSLTGAVTGSATVDGSGNVSITTTATSDPTLTLAGDATGSATFTNLGNATLTVTVVDDSHTHDGRYYTEAESDARFLGITAKAADSNLFDGLDSTSFLRSDAADVQTAGSLLFNDDIELYLGTGSDVTHVWSGGTNYIITQTSGNTYLRTPDFVYFQDQDDTNATRFTFAMSTGNLTATGSMYAQGFVANSSGGAAVPTIRNFSDTDTGAYWDGADAFAISTGGSQVVRFDTRGTEFTGAIQEDVLTGFVTGTPAITPTNGTIWYISLSGSVTFTDSLVDGDSLLLNIEGSATYTITWPASNWTWVGTGGSAPTLETSGRNIISLVKSGGVVYASYAGGTV
jgi:hypothetical protein